MFVRIPAKFFINRVKDFKIIKEPQASNISQIIFNKMPDIFIGVDKYLIRSFNAIEAFNNII